MVVTYTFYTFVRPKIQELVLEVSWSLHPAIHSFVRIVRSFNRSSIVIIFFFYFDPTNAWVAFSFSDASGHNRSSQVY